MGLKKSFEEILRNEIPNGVCDLAWTDSEYSTVAQELCEAAAGKQNIYENLGWVAGSEHFYQLLVTAGQLHSRKNKDYTRFHPLENFFRVSIGTGLPLEGVVAVFLETKLARIESLLGRDPENESLMDSYVDLAVYALLGAVLHNMDEDEKAYIGNLITQNR